MAYQQIEVEVEGVAPLMMHNVQLADPFNEWTRALKAISKKKKKTDEDLMDMARIEFLGGLYVDESEHPCVPGEVLEAMLVEAAKEDKLGKQAKKAIICDGNFRLQYDGPKHPEQLWEDKQFRNVQAVRVSQSRVMRMRPIFHSWSLKFVLNFLPKILNKTDVLGILDKAQLVGLMEKRPRLGRFKVVKTK